MSQIKVDEITYCSKCGVPLHKKCANHCLDCGVEMCDDCYKENRFRCDTCLSQRKTIKTIRRSYLQQYEDCPYSVYLLLNEGVVPPMNGYAQLGIITHELLEKMQHSEIDCRSAINELKKQVEIWNSEVEDDYSIISFDMLNNGIASIEKMEEMLPLFKDDEFKTEYNIEYKIADDIAPTINCTIDRISFKNGTIHVHDWKTGKPMAGKKLEENLQPPMYLYSVFMEFGVLPETFTLHYLAHNKTVTYKHTEGTNYEVKTKRSTYHINLDDAMKKIEGIVRNIVKGKYAMVEDAAHAWRCEKMCWYRKADICSNDMSKGWSNEDK